MSTLPNINILPTSGRFNTSGGATSGSSNSKDVFQSILDSLNGKDSNWVSSLYSDTNKKSPINTQLKSGLGVKGTGIASKASAAARVHKKNDHEDLLVPASLQNQIVMFFEKQGFSLKDINQALSASKNSNGLIQLDKLLAGLSGINSGNRQGKNPAAIFKESFSDFLKDQGIDTKNFSTFFSGVENKNAVLASDLTDLLTGDTKNSSFVESSSIPGVQEILFKMRLGAGEVKKIIEQSKNGNGELELGKLSFEMNKYLSSSLSESDLASLLSRNNISVSKRLFDNINSKSDTANLMPDNSKYLTDEARKDLKQNIEARLKEKGIEEENIKSLLEKIDLTFTKANLEKDTVSGETDPKNLKILSMLNGEKNIVSGVLGDSMKEDIAAFLKRKGSSDKDIKSFMESFSLNTKKVNTGLDDNYLKSSMLNEKALGSSKNDLLLSTSDQGSLKLNLTEMLKLAEEKTKAAQLVKSAEGNAQPLKHGSEGKDRSDFLVKGSPELSGLNISQEKEIKNISRVNQANTSASLPDPLPKIADKMMIMIRTGEYKSRLQITPPELGKLDIALTVKNGHIHASLSTENILVKEVIESNLNQLKQQLNNQGLTVDGFDVMVGLDNGERKEGNTWAKGKNGNGSRHNSGSISDISGEIPVISPVKNNLISDSQIDVHV